MPTPIRHAISSCALALALAACDRGTAADAIVVRDSSGVAIVENDLLRLDMSCAIGATPSVSIGEEEGGEEYELDQVAGAIRLSDGTIVLANRGTHQIRYYDASGRYLRSAGREGEGPGEFREPFYLHALPDDTIYVGDFRPFRFLVFSREGQWMRTVDPKPMMINTPASMNVMANGELVLAVEDRMENSTEQFPMRTLTVQRHAADGTVIDTLARLDHGRYGMVVPSSNLYVFPFFESFGWVTAKGDRLMMGNGATRELRVHRVAAGAPLERILRWTGKSQKITAADIETARARERAAFRPGSPRIPGFEESLAGPGRPVADRFPAFNRIAIGRDRRLWVREFQLPSDSTRWTWVAFDPDGRFECRVETPRFNEVLEFGADYLLARTEDSLGVPRVQQYPLSRPAAAR